jgi:ABC-type bacteriocin/lantibiotic exporter with double-glycine peptidase domain
VFPDASFLSLFLKTATKAAANLQSRFENCVVLRRTMGVYNAGEFVFQKSSNAMANDIKAISDSKWSAAHFVSNVHATGLVFTSLVSLAFILYSIPLARSGNIEAMNHLAAALVILSQLKSPFSQIGQGVEHWLSIAPALCRLDQVIATSASVTSIKSILSDWKVSPSARQVTPKKKSLELRNVQFRYSEEAPNVLKNVSTKFEEGQYTCIVGDSGCGKSTLLNVSSTDDAV